MESNHVTISDGGEHCEELGTGERAEKVCFVCVFKSKDSKGLQFTHFFKLKNSMNIFCIIKHF